MPNDVSIVNPPSHCPKCNTRLRGLDLVPLLSFLALGRKCRYCGAPIGWRYFGVELLTGLIGVALFWKFQANLVDFFLFALFSAALVAVVFIDLDHWIIPDQLNVFGIVIGIGREVVGLVTHESGHSLLRIPIPFTGLYVPMLWSVAGMVICAAIFYGIAFFGELAFKKEAMGGGDVKLAGAIGAVLCGSFASWLGLGMALLSFFIAVFVGSIIGIALMIAQRAKENGHMLPFGPMMVVGVFVTLFYGRDMIGWYLAYLRHGGF